MLALKVREKYTNYFLHRGYHKLPEHSVVNQSQPGVFYNGSAMIPNLEYFLNPDLRTSNRLFTQQRVFLARYSDELTHLPLYSMFQVMMSFYQFQQPNLEEAFANGMELLLRVLGFPQYDLYVLLPESRRDLTEMATRQGIPPTNIVYWKTAPQFQVDNRLEGFYCKFFLKYKHGVLPLFDIVNIEHDGKTVHIDSCLLLERVSFLLQQKDNWYQTEFFAPLVKSLQEQEGPSAYSKRFGYLLTGMMRSITCAMADGADLSNKGPGYVLKKAVRSLLKDKYKYGYKTPLAKLVGPSLDCLEKVGYHFGDVREHLELSLEEEEIAFVKFNTSSERFLKKQVDLLTGGSRDPVTVEELMNWKDSRGIYEDIAFEYLEARGHHVEGYEVPDFEKRRLFFSDGYQFDSSARVDDVPQFLHLLEKQ